jgi:hypothetical protein
MGENLFIYDSATSRGSTIMAGGRVRNIIEVWDVLSGRGVATVLDNTLYETGSGHLAVSDRGGRVAIADYYNGVEVWEWRLRKLLWRSSKMTRVQSVAFASDDQELIIGVDTGAVITAAHQGSILERVSRISNVVASPCGRLLVGRRGKQLVLIRRGLDEPMVLGRTRSFASLAAAFTREALIVSETDASARAFRLTDGTELLLARGWCVSLATIQDQEVVIGWANVVRAGVDGTIAGTDVGELIRCDLVEGKATTIQSRNWQAAHPVLYGTAWVFGDGSMITVV